MALHELPREYTSVRRRGPSGRAIAIIVLVVAVLAARSVAELVIEYEWWKELGQLQTWENIILYSVAPVAAATLLAFAVLWIVHARALKFASTGLGEHSLYAKISTA